MSDQMRIALDIVLALTALIGLVLAGRERGSRLAADKLVAELKRLVTIDPLTGLLNKRGLEERVEDEEARAKRSGKELSVLFFDIDDFAAVNEKLGHVMADQLLVVVAKTTMEVLRRQTDKIGRFGGDEFVAILPDVDHEEALLLADRVRLAISAKFIGADAPITISVGVATYEESEQDLITLADLAMYKAKDAGKNQIHNGSMGGKSVL